MSKHIRKLYSKIDKQINSAPKQAEPTKGLVGKRGAPTDEGLDPVVDYVTYIREARESKNGYTK
tara:strand:+ start:860 stop:1051 length:192 start_codon:yes stop_codon:yes gene_type:complete